MGNGPGLSMSSTLVGRLAGSLTRSRFTQNVAVLGGGTALAQCILVLASPLLTRLYLPADMGLMGLYVAYFGFVTVAASLRYETAIVSAPDRQQAAYLTLISMALALPSSLVCAGVLYLLIRTSVLGFGHLPWFTAFFVIPSVLLTGMFAALRYWYVREESLVTVSRALVIQNSARSILQVGLGELRWGWLGLIGGDILGRGAGIGRMFRRVWPVISSEVFPLKWKKIAEVLRSYRKFPVYSLPSALIDALAMSLPLPLIAGLYGTEPAGHFSLVLRVLSLPLALVGTSVGDAFHGRMATHVREEPNGSARFFYRTARGLFLLGVGPAVLLVVFGEDIFRLVFGQDWTLSGKLATAMAPWTLAQLVVSPLSRVVYVLQGQELKLVYDVVSLSLTVIAVLVCHALGFTVFHTVVWLSLVNVLANGLYFVLLARIVERGQ